MAARPTWQGHLRLSLVSCPVAMYTATSRAGEVHFNMLHKKTHNRIRMIPTDPELGPIERSDIVKGFEVSKDHYVVISQDEIDNVRLESTRTIDIDRFVDESEIDRLYWNDPYYLVPDGKVAVEAFSVIREAMEKAGKIALGRVVMHQRERLLAMEPRDKGLLAYTLRTNNEVRKPEDIFGDIPNVRPDKDMIDIAARIIDQKAGDFDPSGFKDHYEDALRALIEEKQKSHGKIATVEEPKEAQVIDLMEALRRSLGDKGGSAKKKPAAKKAPATAHKKAPAKKRA